MTSISWQRKIEQQDLRCPSHVCHRHPDAQVRRRCCVHYCGIISAIAACMAVIALRRKDRTEFFCTGQAQKIGFKDYVDVISHNRAIQMLVVNASTDKLASSMMSSSVIMVMLYGILCGNYAQYGLMSAATSIPVVVGGMLVIRLVASRVVHTAFWSTAGSWACSICLSAGRVSDLHSLWLTS